MKHLYIRVKTSGQLQAVREWMEQEGTSATLLAEYELAGAGIMQEGMYLCLPDAGRQSRISSIREMILALPCGAGVLVRNLDELGLLLETGFQGPVIGDSFLYAYNSEALSFYEECFPGMQFILSDELTDRELEELIRKSALPSERFIYKAYGFQPLMITNQCLSRNYTDCRKKELRFTDQKGASFTAVSRCSQCTSVIYNGLCTYMLDRTEEMGFSNILLDFTLESPGETTNILKGQVPGNYTRGHHYKGID